MQAAIAHLRGCQLLMLTVYLAQWHAQVIHRDLKLENILLKGASPSTQDAKLSVRKVLQQSLQLGNRGMLRVCSRA